MQLAVIMYVCNVCKYVMYVIYVIYVMYVIYVNYVCNECMQCMCSRKWYIMMLQNITKCLPCLVASVQCTTAGGKGHFSMSE